MPQRMTKERDGDGWKMIPDDQPQSGPVPAHVFVNLTQVESSRKKDSQLRKCVHHSGP